MKIYPAIDLKSGYCVRLTQGNHDQVTLYPADPVILAKSFANQGAKILHVVDLDGARDGQSVNLELIEQITKKSGLLVQTGGGIRTKQQINEILNKGIYRVVLGSIAIDDSDNVKQWLKEFGAEKIVLALDVRVDAEGVPNVSTHGWQQQTSISLWQLLDDYQSAGLIHVLCTDIHRDGMMQGPNIQLYEKCVARYPKLLFQASGGVGQLSDLYKLKKLNLEAVIVGKAIYENKFSFEDALTQVELC